MNPKTQLSPKEWQLLSAYLDDQVSSTERIRIEKRLDSEDAFRQALQSLRQTRTVIRSMPRRRVPRNFTLTPEMVAVRQMPRILPVLRFSSAFAAIAAFILFGVQLLPMMAKSAAAPTQAPAALEMSAAEAPASTEPPLIYWGTPGAEAAKGMGGGGGGFAGGMGGGAPDTIFGMPNDASTPSIQFEIPQATSEPGIGAAGEPQVTMPVEPTPYAEATAAPPMAMAPQPTATPEQPLNQATLEGNPILGLRPQDSGKIISESTTADSVRAVESESSRISIGSLLLPVTIGLAALALLTAIAAFVLWKKTRS
ncbi:hypothetical protein LARV_03289 [Longilinea arvoryzae]|uniref:Uncharacterized protein n=1 Tax=Longilinea arvoryzae TaxID=360412 RepID=A0A0S7BCA3_9CHLR|nr:hypothetical protein [Longilinea arvoryzae]GAP15500.1 hypothetical protein LARV_03289 [Longilinea arvoryzae]